MADRQGRQSLTPLTQRDRQVFISPSYCEFPQFWLFLLSASLTTNLAPIFCVCEHWFIQHCPFEELASYWISCSWTLSCRSSQTVNGKHRSSQHFSTFDHAKPRGAHWFLLPVFGIPLERPEKLLATNSLSFKPLQRRLSKDTSALIEQDQEYSHSLMAYVGLPAVCGIIPPGTKFWAA